MDIKAPLDIYDHLTGVHTPMDRIKESIELIANNHCLSKRYRNHCDLSRDFMQIRIRPFSSTASETVYPQKSCMIETSLFVTVYLIRFHH